MTGDTHDPLVTGAAVCPLRFTARPVEMIAFYELLGLQLTVRQGDWAVLQGRGGRIAVHPLATAASATETTTSLVLEVPDAAEAADRLAAAGLDATWWDESFGRQATVSGPVGVLFLNGELDDPYGHEVHPATGSSPADVVATISTDDLDGVASFFSAFGFVAGPGSGRDWRPLRADSRSGILGLLRTTDPAVELPPSATTEIGIVTTEPLDVLSSRLEAAGHPVTRVDDEGPPHLIVLDPDGIRLEVSASDEA